MDSLKFKPTRKKYSDMCNQRTRLIYNSLGEASRVLVPLSSETSFDEKKSPKNINFIIPSHMDKIPEIFRISQPITTTLPVSEKVFETTLNSLREFVDVRVQMEICSIKKKDMKVLSLGGIIKCHFCQYHGVNLVAKKQMSRFLHNIRAYEVHSPFLRIVGRILGVSKFPKLANKLEDTFYELWIWFHARSSNDGATTSERKKDKVNFKAIQISKKDLISCVRDVLHVRGRHYPPIILEDLTAVLHSKFSSRTEMKNLPLANECLINIEDALEIAIHVFERNDEIIMEIDRSIFGENALPRNLLSACSRDINSLTPEKRRENKLCWKEKTLHSFIELKQLTTKFVVHDDLRRGLISKIKFSQVLNDWIGSDVMENGRLEDFIATFDFNASTDISYIDCIAYLYSQILETTELLPLRISNDNVDQVHRGMETEKFNDLFDYISRLIVIRTHVSSVYLLMSSLFYYDSTISLDDEHNAPFGMCANHDAEKRTQKHFCVDNELMTEKSNSCDKYINDYSLVRRRLNDVSKDQSKKADLHLIYPEFLHLWRNPHSFPKRLDRKIDNSNLVRSDLNTSNRNKIRKTARSLHAGDDFTRANIDSRLPGTNSIRMSLPKQKIIIDQSDAMNQKSHQRSMSHAKSTTNSQETNLKAKIEAIFEQNDLLDWKNKARGNNIERSESLNKDHKKNLKNMSKFMENNKILREKVLCCENLDDTESVTIAGEILPHREELDSEASQLNKLLHENEEVVEGVKDFIDNDSKEQKPEEVAFQAVCLIQHYFRKAKIRRQRVLIEKERILSKQEKKKMQLEMKVKASLTIQRYLRSWLTCRQIKLEREKGHEKKHLASIAVLHWISKIINTKKIIKLRNQSAIIMQCLVRRIQAKAKLLIKKSIMIESQIADYDRKDMEKESSTKLNEEKVLESTCADLVRQIVQQSILNFSLGSGAAFDASMQSKEKPAIELFNENLKEENDGSLIHLWLMERWDWETFFDDIECTLLRIASLDFRIHNNLRYHRLKKNIKEWKREILKRRNFLVDYNIEKNSNRERIMINFPIEKTIMQCMKQNASTLDEVYESGMEPIEQIFVERQNVGKNKNIRMVQGSHQWQTIKYRISR